MPSHATGCLEVSGPGPEPKRRASPSLLTCAKTEGEGIHVEALAPQPRKRGPPRKVSTSRSLRKKYVSHPPNRDTKSQATRETQITNQLPKLRNAANLTKLAFLNFRSLPPIENRVVQLQKKSSNPASLTKPFISAPIRLVSVTTKLSTKITNDAPWSKSLS